MRRAARSTSMVRGCLFLLLAFPACAPAAQSAPAANIGSPTGARELFQQGKFREAAAAYRALAEKQPSAEAYSGLVQSLLKLDDVKAADESSQKALAALPGAALAHAARGDAYFRRGLIAEAESEYKAALKLDDKCARAWLGQGKVDTVYTRRKHPPALSGKC
jgi:tetratricopeptide (TPR) repeat protein